MADLLIDADITLMRASSAAEVEIDWGDDLWTLSSDAGEAYRNCKDDIERTVETVAKAYGKPIGEAILCFSDPSRRTFRHDLTPTYKANRKGTRKPLAYHPLRERLMGEFKSIIKPGLEADDCLGIVSTRAPGRYIISSADKDLKTIPGLLFWQERLREITVKEADYWHLYQTLIGDVTDGYPGCPGVGPATATEVLANPRKLVKVDHVLARGPRKGQTEVRWEESEPCSPWQAVVCQYVKAGLTPNDALLQARLARILRASDWDFDKSEVKLWMPPI